jgi:predicted nuclease with TOPRIM domain
LARIAHLEEEKNALLDYIEDSEQNGNDPRVSQLSARIKQLEAENANLYQMTENLKYQEAMSRHKVEDLSHQVHSLS